jgi:alpha-L-fucosidase
VGLLANACKKYDIKFCIYYSVLDWYSTDNPLHNDETKQPDANAHMEAYVLYMKNQLKELITTYHPYMLWFDGNWESPWTQEMGAKLYAFIKRLDPSLIINNRLGKGNHKTITAETVGDFATPEQEIGKMNMDNPWESCITICRQWAWKPNDEMKTLRQCLETLAGTAGGNGNLLLNISPMPDGRIEQRQVGRLQEIGNWLEKNGDALYNTKGGPYVADSIKSSTRKGNKIYLHVFDGKNHQLQLANVPGCTLKKAYFLMGNPVQSQQNSQQITLSWQGPLPDDNDAVIVMEMDQSIENLPLINNLTK